MSNILGGTHTNERTDTHHQDINTNRQDTHSVESTPPEHKHTHTTRTQTHTHHQSTNTHTPPEHNNKHTSSIVSAAWFAISLSVHERLLTSHDLATEEPVTFNWLLSLQLPHCCHLVFLFLQNRNNTLGTKTKSKGRTKHLQYTVQLYIYK